MWQPAPQPSPSRRQVCVPQLLLSTVVHPLLFEHLFPARPPISLQAPTKRNVARRIQGRTYSLRCSWFRLLGYPIRGLFAAR